MKNKTLLKSINVENFLYANGLSNIEKDNLRNMLDGFFKYDISIPFSGIDVNQVEKIYQVLKIEKPILFFVEKITCRYMPVLKCGSIIPKYRFAELEIEATISALELKIGEIYLLCDKKSEFEKELIVHDYLCKTVSYDTTFKASSFECVGPILFGKGVCEGISKAAKLIFDSINIESAVVCGESTAQNNYVEKNNSHAWNIVKIDGNYYHLDITYDLTVMSFDIIRYDYFNLSDRDIFIDHNFLCKNLPTCNTDKNYYIKKHMYMENKDMFRSYFMNNIKRRNRDIVFKLPYVTDVNETVNEIMQIVQDCINKVRYNTQYQLTYNENQRVFHLHDMRRF